MTAPTEERAVGAERDEELERIVAEEEKTLARVQKAIQNRHRSRVKALVGRTE